MIGFVGSVFSPYYAWARRRHVTDPQDFCAINCALYSPGNDRWAMTERRADRMYRDATHLRVGPSVMRWTGNALEIELDEIGMPLPRRIRGSIRLSPEILPQRVIMLDHAGRHRWQPVAPLARVEARFEHPDLRWQGHGYFDMNSGDEPLERGFRSWQWSRARTADGAAILYNGIRRDGSRFDLALLCDPEGGVTEQEPPPRHRLPATLWRVQRDTGSAAGSMPRVVRTLEDTPFYTRSLVQGVLGNQYVTMMHEGLDLDRFSSRLVQVMLPFRMPRRF